MIQMIRCWVLVSIILVFSGSVLGQISFEKGIKAGLNVSNLRDDPDETDFETKNGIVFGGFLGIDPLGPMAFQVEVLYSQKGAKVSVGTNEATVSVNYLEIPVLVKLTTPVAPPLVSANFYAGPAVAFKLSSKTEVNGQKIDDPDSAEDDLKSSDLGGVLGANLSFSALGLAAVMVDLRYTLGLSDITDAQDADPQSIKNGVVSLTVGLGF